MVKVVLSVIATGVMLAPSADGGIQRSERSPRERVAKVACWVPALGYGVRKGVPVCAHREDQALIGART
jgi:hypothetical protein